MGRACKCKACGKKLNTDNAYKTERKGKNVYFCNQEEYETWYKENEQRAELEKSLGEAVEATIGKVFNNSTWGEMRKTLSYWKEQGYSLEDSVKYLWDVSDQVRHLILEKTFLSEFSKAKYYFAVVRNHIQEYFKTGSVELLNNYEPERVEITHRESDLDMSPAKYKAKPSKRTLAEIEDDEDDEELM